MTVYGYVRVKPSAVAGTSSMQGWWMRYHGCEQVYADVWIGEGIPPALDLLVGAVCPGDEVRVAEWAALGPSRECQDEAMELFTRREVKVTKVDGSPPDTGRRMPPISVRMVT